MTPPVGHAYLHLSDLAKTLIVDYLPVSDRIKFSTCSKKTDAIVRSIRSRPYSLTWKTGDELKISISASPQDQWEVLILEAGSPEEEERGLEQLVLNGIPVTVRHTDPYPIWQFSSASEMHALTTFLTGHLNVDVFNAFFNPVFPRDSFIWDHTRRLEYLRMCADDPQTVQLSPDTLCFLLEELRVKELDMSATITDPEFRYSKGLQCESVVISRGSWLHVDAILDSQTVKLQLNGHTPSAGELNAILKRWVSGGMDRMESIEYNSFGPTQTMQFIEEVFDGVVFTDWNPHETKKIVLIEGRPRVFKDGREIVRSDGKKRAIIKARFGRFFEFVMFVFPPDHLIRHEPRRNNQ